MSYMAFLIPIALGMGLAGLAAFLWSMRSGQYEDLDGAAERILLDQEQDQPLQDGVSPSLADRDGGSGTGSEHRH